MLFPDVFCLMQSRTNTAIPSYHCSNCGKIAGGGGLFWLLKSVQNCHLRVSPMWADPAIHRRTRQCVRVKMGV